MEKARRSVFGALIGALCAAAAAGLAVVLIRSLGQIAGLLGVAIGEAAARQFSNILSQLRTALVLPPVRAALSIGTVLGFVFIKNGKRIAGKASALVLLLTALCVCFAQVNGIRLYSAVQIVLKLVQAGAF